jgi:hypothetical protein
MPVSESRHSHPRTLLPPGLHLQASSDSHMGHWDMRTTGHRDMHTAEEHTCLPCLQTSATLYVRKPTSMASRLRVTPASSAYNVFHLGRGRSCWQCETVSPASQLALQRYPKLARGTRTPFGSPTQGFEGPGAAHSARCAGTLVITCDETCAEQRQCHWVECMLAI